MKRLAETCELIAATTKKSAKSALLGDFLLAVPQDEAAVSSLFLSGRPFAAWEETTLNVGGSLLWRTIEELAGEKAGDLPTTYRQHGDLGSVAAEVLPENASQPELSAVQVQERFRKIAAARGPAAKTGELRGLFAHASALEAKYIIKIITGDLRVGLKESLVEEAIAKAYGATLPEVQRANMLLGDIGETLKLAAAGQLNDATMRLFHPLGFMLASPAADATDALRYFDPALVEDKYDGVRAQAHVAGGKVKIFSRTRDEITNSFPELYGPLAALPDDAILDGEIVAWSYPAAEENEAGRALPFSAVQKRLGRKKVSRELMRQVPVAYVVFDIFYAAGKLLIDLPLREREEILDELLAAERVARASAWDGSQGELELAEAESPNPTKVIRAPVFAAQSAEELDQLFDAAQARGNEGLMIKDPESTYHPGRRGKSWLKLKRELATLDVVVTAVEYGHGKRARVLSDYTFAVRDGERLLNIGKAYSGLTDAEIAEMTGWFLDHTLEDQGFRRIVEPRIVLEVAFNNMMRSDRHSSGYALRFPRIVRLRPDKLAEDADTLDRAKEIYASQETEAKG
jgi:DNA ligase-1